MNNIGPNRIDQIFAGKVPHDKAIEGKLIDGYGNDHDVTYLLSQVKLAKGTRDDSKISVKKAGGHLIWTIGKIEDVAMGSSWIDHFKIGFKEFKHNFKMYFDFFDTYKKHSASKLDKKIALINDAYEKCLKLEAPSEANLLSALRKVTPNSKLLENLFAEDSKMENPEDWAVILPDVRKYLKTHPEYQKIWEEIIDRKFDLIVKPVYIQLPDFSEVKLPKSVLTSQSQPLKNMFSDLDSSEKPQLKFPDMVSDQAKRCFVLCMKYGFQDYPTDVDIALDLYCLADSYDVNWMQNDLRDHLVKNFNAFTIYDGMHFKDFADTVSLEQLKDSPHKRLYLACIKKMATEGLSLDQTDEQFKDFFNEIKKKNDNHLNEALQRAMVSQLGELPNKLKEFKQTDEQHTFVFRMIDRYNRSAALNPDWLDLNLLKKVDTYKEEILEITLPGLKQPKDIIKYLEFAHLQNDMTVYDVILGKVEYLARECQKKYYLNLEKNMALEEIVNYANKNNLLDVMLRANPSLDINNNYMSCRLSENGSFNNDVNNFLLVLETNPQAKILQLCSLNMVANKKNPTTEELTKITSLLQSKVFSDVNFEYISDGYAKGLVDALEKGCDELVEISIRNSHNGYYYNLTNVGLEAITKGVINSNVRVFRLEEPTVLVSADMAKSIADDIKLNVNLEKFVFRCEYENREAFDLVFNAVVANKNLKIIELVFKGDGEERKQLEGQRAGLTIHNSRI
jgi:hypothetical protein